MLPTRKRSLYCFTHRFLSAPPWVAMAVTLYLLGFSPRWIFKYVCPDVHQEEFPWRRGRGMLRESGELILKLPILNLSVPSDHPQSENCLSVNNSSDSFGLHKYIVFCNYPWHFEKCRQSFEISSSYMAGFATGLVRWSESCILIGHRSRWAYIARPGSPALSRKKKKCFCLIIKLDRSKWMNNDLIVVLFSFWIFTDKGNAKKDLGQYLAILSEQA